MAAVKCNRHHPMCLCPYNSSSPPSILSPSRHTHLNNPTVSQPSTTLYSFVFFLSFIPLFFSATHVVRGNLVYLLWISSQGCHGDSNARWRLCQISRAGCRVDLECHCLVGLHFSKPLLLYILIPLSCAICSATHLLITTVVTMEALKS